MQLTFKGKARADEKAPHTWEYVSVLKRLATPSSGVGCFFEMACSRSPYIPKRFSKSIRGARRQSARVGPKPDRAAHKALFRRSRTDTGPPAFLNRFSNFI